MRRILIPLAAIALMANSPAEIDSLLEAGSDAQAFAMAQAGADAGDAELTGYLGWFYDNGRHVDTDPAHAARLFRKAADAGDAYAQWRLGVLIDNGMVSGTPEEAVVLFRKAAAQKSSDGMVGLAVMHAMGRGVERDFAASMRYYQAAARLGNAHGLQGMGVLYANGEGVEADLTEAMAYWLVATAVGNDMAQQLLDEHLTKLEDDQAANLIGRATEISQTYGIAADFDLTGDNAEKGGVGEGA